MIMGKGTHFLWVNVGCVWTQKITHFQGTHSYTNTPPRYMDRRIAHLSHAHTNVLREHNPIKKWVLAY